MQFCITKYKSESTTTKLVQQSVHAVMQTEFLPDSSEWVLDVSGFIRDTVTFPTGLPPADISSQCTTALTQETINDNRSSDAWTKWNKENTSLSILLHLLQWDATTYEKNYVSYD